MKGMELKTERLRRGLTQEQLAEKLGVSTTSVMNWETERHSPSPMAASLLEKFFDQKLSGNTSNFWRN